MGPVSTEVVWGYLLSEYSNVCFVHTSRMCREYLTWCSEYLGEYLGEYLDEYVSEYFVNNFQMCSEYLVNISIGAVNISRGAVNNFIGAVNNLQ